jgi:hypothetical protein
MKYVPLTMVIVAATLVIGYGLMVGHSDQSTTEQVIVAPVSLMADVTDGMFSPGVTQVQNPGVVSNPSTTQSGPIMPVQQTVTSQFQAERQFNQQRQQHLQARRLYVIVATNVN